MLRAVIRSAVVLAPLIALVLVRPARAEDPPPPPTAAQRDAARAAFQAGKALHEAGRYADAVARFKDSYRLSREPLLLYNIGYTLDLAGEREASVFYYRQFLAEAAADVPQRAQVTARVAELERAITAVDAAPPPPPPPPVPPPPTLEHLVVDAAPPGQPLDITAVAPRTAGLVVTLHTRSAGEVAFTARPMRWRYHELVARVPAPAVAGSALHYYVELADASGAVIARSGKPSSPHLVRIEAGATPRFYPDLDADTVTPAPVGPIAAPAETENPLPALTTAPPPPRDAEPGWHRSLRWGTTIGGVVALGASVVFLGQARKYARSIEDDTRDCGTPPCRAYDDFGSDVQRAGERWEIVTNAALVVGVVATGAAAVTWVRWLSGRRTKPPTPTTAWWLAPSAAPGFTGAAAGGRF